MQQLISDMDEMTRELSYDELVALRRMLDIAGHEAKEKERRRREAIESEKRRKREEVKTRIKQGKGYENDPFTLYDILIYDDLTLQEKMRKNENGKWVPSGEYEWLITAYSVLKEE